MPNDSKVKTDSNDNIILELASGETVTVKASDVEFNQNLVPETDGDGELGSSSKSWGAVNAEELPNADHIIQPTGGSGVGEDGPPGADPWTMDESFLTDFRGTVLLESGRWITSGLGTDSTIDWDYGPVYVTGTGVWGSVVEHEDGSSPTILLASTEGNGGGIRDITVYGAGSDAGTANVVESDGNSIDHVFRDSIIRYGGGDALHLPSSASGARIQNMWVETCGGHGIYVGAGNRLKLSDLHVVGNDEDQLNLSMIRSHADGITVDGGNNGVNLQGGARNSFSNIVSANVGGTALLIGDGNGRNQINNVAAFGPDTTLWLRGSDANQNAVSNVLSFKTRRRGVKVSNNFNTLTNITVWGFSGGSTSYEGVLIQGNNNDLVNIHIGPGDGNGVDPMSISGNNNIVQNLILHANITGTLEVSGTENQIWGTKRLSYSQISDNGTRTMINGWSTNGGDPNTTGQWNGEAALAGRLGITVWDTSTAPWTPHEAQPDGSSWVAT